MTHDEWLAAREDEREVNAHDATPHIDGEGCAAAPVSAVESVKEEREAA